MANPEGIGGPQPGEVRNPEGKNGHLKGWQRYGDRLQKWLDKSGEEIQQVFSDPTQMAKLSSIDIICAQHARDMMVGEAETRHKSREAALDRIEGKPKQTHAVGGDPDNQTPINLDGTFTLTFGTEDNDGSDPTPAT